MEFSNVLVVDADPETRLEVVSLVEPLCDRVVAVASAEEAMARLAERRFALMVTDVLLPDRDGISLLAELHQEQPNLKIVVYSAFVSVEAILRALHQGACTYIRKPEGAAELQARVRRELANHRIEVERNRLLHTISSSLMSLAETPDHTYHKLTTPGLRRIGCLTIDTARQRVFCHDRSVDLSSGEFALLEYLAQHPDQVRSPQQIARSVLEYDCDPYEARELIKPRIHRLRRKIELDPADPKLLLSIRGAGYLLSSEDHDTT